MRLHKVAVARVGAPVSAANQEWRPTGNIGNQHYRAYLLPYEKKGKKMFGFYIIDGFTDGVIEYQFGFETKEMAKEVCHSVLPKKMNDQDQRILEYVRSRPDEWFMSRTVSKVLKIPMYDVTRRSRQLFDKGLIERELRHNGETVMTYLKAKPGTGGD